MSDPLIVKYVPQLRGHVVKKYRWMEERGNCLVTVDDIVQVASIVLMKLASTWDDYLAGVGKTRDGNDALFWTFLEHQVKQEVLKYYKRVGKEGRESADSSLDAFNMERLEGQARMSVFSCRPDPLHWSTIRDSIVDFFQTMPLKDKIYIALRYFDELPTDDAAALLGTSSKTYINQVATFVARWRHHAISQVVVEGHPPQVARRVEMGWEPLQVLTEYVHNRHRVDLHEYVWYVSECFRQDVGYLAAILGRDRTTVTGDREGGRSTVTPAQRREIAHMLDHGFNCKEISRQLGVSYSAVRWTRDNPRTYGQVA